MSYDEVGKAFKNGTLTIDCISMTLTQRDAETPAIYYGKGYIQQTDGDQLSYKLYVTNGDNLDQTSLMLRSFNALAGKVIEPDEYYDLVGVDVHGQAWRSERIQVHGTWSNDHLPILNGRLRYISAETRSRSPAHSVSIECFNEIDFPATFGRQMTGAPITDNFKLAEIEFTTHQFDSGFKITALSPTPLGGSYYLRIVEALKFVTAKQVHPRIITHVTGESSVQYFSADSVPNPRIQQFPPLSPTSWAYARDSKVLFDRYLSFIQMVDTGEHWHFLTFFLDNAAQATGASLHAWAAGLGVAVEGLLTLVDVPRDPRVVATSKDFAAWVVAQVKNDKKFASFAPRIAGMVGNMEKVGPKDRMQILIDKGLVHADLRKAWSDLRNSNVHPDANALDQNRNVDTQPFFDRICKTTVLMYLIVFHLIDYVGEYSNYAVHGFPDAAFPSISGQHLPEQATSASGS